MREVEREGGKEGGGREGERGGGREIRREGGRVGEVGSEREGEGER